MAVRQWIDWSGSEELTIKGHEGTFWIDENVYVNFTISVHLCLLKFSKLFTLCTQFVNISTAHKIQALGQPWFWMLCLNDGGHASEKSSVLLPSQDTKVV